MTAAEDHCFETFDALVDGPLAICSIITDAEGQPADYRFLRVSDCFEDRTGLREVEGRTVLELLPGLEKKWIELVGRVALDRVPARFMETSEATGHLYEVRAAPLNPPGHFVMVLTDVTQVQKLEAERKAALEHAQDLLKELGHRVMNSFASISAIVAMETRATPAEGRAALERVQRRVQALASLYRRLDGASQVDRIEVSDYLGGIVTSFRDSLGAARDVSIEADLAAMTLSTRVAVPLALVLNELLTNAVKHAFDEGGAGQVRVSLRDEDGTCRLEVADDGSGMAGAGSGEGVGRGLVAAFVAELGGTLSTESGAQGTRLVITFPR